MLLLWCYVFFSIIKIYKIKTKTKKKKKKQEKKPVAVLIAVTDFENNYI